MIRLTLFLIALALPAAATNPIADVICEPKARMTEKLTRNLRSERKSMGLRGPEQVVEVWTDSQGDWTMVITYASGQSCIVAMGEAWTDTAKKDPA
ncbi:hypothetical protein [Pseudooceanicola sp. MF1-13]|uniref:hypothetical protein n=1 Tax=Pseudooceanicola sp. MF1-13 TaxID=3379095 RepID=UPI0038927647